MTLRTQLGKSVRAIRLELEMTQEELAQKAGLHSTYIGGVERGERNVSIDNVEKIAKALSTAPGNLLPRNSESKRIEAVVKSRLSELQKQLLSDLRAS